MSRLREGLPSRPGGGGYTPNDVEETRAADPSPYATILDRVDRALSREHAGDAELMLVQAFATVWAGLGWLLWVTLWLTWRVLAWAWRVLTAPFRRRGDDGEFTTTVKKRGRPRSL